MTKMNPKRKVLAYITRSSSNGTQMLVFEHADYPTAGLQVPAGSVDDDEKVESAVIREIKEESGLVIVQAPIPLGSFRYFREDIKQHQIRYVFHIPFRDPIADTWMHSVKGTGEDKDLVFRFYWIEILRAQSLLAANQGDYIPFLPKAS